jgi:hypothetical protein
MPVKGNPGKGQPSPSVRNRESVLLDMRNLQDELNSIDEELLPEQESSARKG